MTIENLMVYLAIVTSRYLNTILRQKNLSLDTNRIELIFFNSRKTQLNLVICNALCAMALKSVHLKVSYTYI